MGSHTPSSEDLSPFLDDGGRCARSLWWLKLVPTELGSAQQQCNVAVLLLLVSVSRDAAKTKAGTDNIFKMMEHAYIDLFFFFFYHWRELPQVSVLSRRNTYVFCCDKSMLLLRQKYACRDKTLRHKHTFFATKDVLSRQTYFFHAAFVDLDSISRQERHRLVAKVHICVLWNIFICSASNFVCLPR